MRCRSFTNTGHVCKISARPYSKYCHIHQNEYITEEEYMLLSQLPRETRHSYLMRTKHRRNKGTQKHLVIRKPLRKGIVHDCTRNHQVTPSGKRDLVWFVCNIIVLLKKLITISCVMLFLYIVYLIRLMMD